MGERTTEWRARSEERELDKEASKNGEGVRTRASGRANRKGYKNKIRKKSRSRDVRKVAIRHPHETERIGADVKEKER